MRTDEVRHWCWHERERAGVQVLEGAGLVVEKGKSTAWGLGWMESKESRKDRTKCPVFTVLCVPKQGR